MYKKYIVYNNIYYIIYNIIFCCSICLNKCEQLHDWYIILPIYIYLLSIQGRLKILNLWKFRYTYRFQSMLS